MNNYVLILLCMLVTSSAFSKVGAPPMSLSLTGDGKFGLVSANQNDTHPVVRRFTFSNLSPMVTTVLSIRGIEGKPFKLYPTNENSCRQGTKLGNRTSCTIYLSISTEKLGGYEEKLEIEARGTSGKIVTSSAALSVNIVPSGTLDKGLAQTGTIHFPLNSYCDWRTGTASLTSLQDGSILAAVGCNKRSGKRSVLTIKFKSDGSLDPTFGQRGISELWSTQNKNYNVVSLSNISKDMIEVYGDFDPGAATSQPFIGRFSLKGTPDLSVGSGGIVLLPTEGLGRVYVSKVLRPKGQLLMVTNTDLRDVVVFSMREDLSIDTAFGDRGMFFVSKWATKIYSRGGAWTKDGNLVLLLAGGKDIFKMDRYRLMAIDRTGKVVESFKSQIEDYRYGVSKLILDSLGNFQVFGGGSETGCARATFDKNGSKLNPNSKELGYVAYPRASQAGCYGMALFYPNGGVLGLVRWPENLDEPQYGMQLGMFKSDGSIDKFFGNNGSLILDFTRDQPDENLDPFVSPGVPITDPSGRVVLSALTRVHAFGNILRIIRMHP